MGHWSTGGCEMTLWGRLAPGHILSFGLRSSTDVMIRFQFAVRRSSSAMGNFGC